MSFEISRFKYNGKIREIKLGCAKNAVMVGGETSYPFHLFEGEMPNLPRIAMEVYDVAPDDWPETGLKPFKDLISDPVKWARKCIDEYGAEMICLQLLSTDPNGADRDAGEAAAVVKKVADEIDIPLIVWGTANHEKDTEVLKKVAEVCYGKNLILGPAEEDDYKKIAAAAMAYGHTIIASSPIDVNLAKQLNILLGNLGVPDSRILIDPTVSSIGYGIEYTYSVMERMRIAALTQQDDKLQFPVICNIARETWKTKEAEIPYEEDPKLGDVNKRGIMLEAMSAAVLLFAGADILIMRHPESIKLIREMISDLISV
jgi:acetyl-CoA decarbonylase/synthase complex subunit delta